MSTLDHLLGIWIEPEIIDEVPFTLPDRNNSNFRHGIRIRETVSVSDIWISRWIENLEMHADKGAYRSLLLGTLLEEFRLDRDENSNRFTPVFHVDDEISNVQAEMASLVDHFPNLLPPPLYQDSATGRLFPSRKYRA